MKAYRLRLKLTIPVLLFVLMALVTEVLAANNQANYASKAHFVSAADLDEIFYKVRIPSIIYLDINNMSIEESLQHIAGQTGLRVSYRGDVLTDKKVTLQKEQVSVSDAIDLILRDTGLEYNVSQEGYLLVTLAN